MTHRSKADLATLTALAAVLLLAPTRLWAQAAPVAQDTCVACHTALEGDLGRPAQLFDLDIHKKNGFSCVDCHGGDRTSDDLQVSMGRAHGFLGKVDRRAIPALCARCHSDAVLMHRFKPQQRVDQLAEYKTSVHGKRLAAGDTHVATCIDCHSVHNIREVKDAESPVYPLHVPETCAHCHANAEYMKAYKIPTDQFEKYRRSVHWQALAERGDLSAPSCATCHGNHGAAPPGVTSVARVCGTCHVVFENLFDKSPHKAAFDAMGLGGCVVCHSNHEIKKPSVQMVGVQQGATCVQCHQDGDKGYEAAKEIRAKLDDLSAAIQRSDAILKTAETSGMEVSEGRLQLTAANEGLIQAEVNLHSFDPAVVDAAAKKGFEASQASYVIGQKALEERDYRRKGLALSLATIAVAMAGLWLTVRQVDRKRRNNG
jgi:predicted CXXCH cytochrome family protein